LRIIDIDKLIEIDNHIYYIKLYKGSLMLMNNMGQIIRKEIKFSIEYKPVGDPVILAEILETDNLKIDHIMPNIIKRIEKLDKDGVLSSATKGV